MFEYLIYTLNSNNQWVEMQGWIRPFTDGQTLDDSLDTGTIDVLSSSVEEPLKPFTRVRIDIKENNAIVDALHYLVESDTVITKRQGSPRVYAHQIKFIELTKLLERDVCDTMTVTNALAHNYNGIAVDLNETGNAIDREIVIRTNVIITTPKLVGTSFIFPTMQEMYALNQSGTAGTLSWGDFTISYSNPNGETTTFATNTTQAVELNIEGVYVFNCVGNVIETPLGAGDPVPFNLNYSVEISVITALQSTEEWTITGVVNRLLQAGVTTRVDIDDLQKYTFDETQATYFDTIPAPEFYFTRGTLRDALSIVGGFIHGIPRLVANNTDNNMVLRFDLLDESEDITVAQLPIYEDSYINCDEYCDAVDSIVENAVSTMTNSTGSITEPGEYFRAVNTTSGFTIEKDNMVILTERPINQIQKVECQYNGVVYDITPYVYEKAEYDALSGYQESSYPYSKGWAIVYTSGQKNIDGLSFVLEKADTIATFKNEYAIVNILESLGAIISTSSDLVNLLSFRVTYVPIVTTRVLQKKPYLSHPQQNTLIYNQGGNTVEAEYYGERLKGTILRIGNITHRKTYLFDTYAELPRVGQRIDGEYIATIDRMFEKSIIKVTISTVKNFNKLAEYISINSNYRLYEVSEKQSVDRYVNYSEACVISHSQVANVGSPLATSSLALYTIGALATNTNATLLPRPTALIRAKSGRDYNPNNSRYLQRIGSACNILAMGNSIVFSVDMFDNYGAGYESLDVELENKRAQRLVPYTDEVGCLSTAEIKIGVYPIDVFNYPIQDNFNGTYIFMDTDSKPFVILKDSREALHYVLQEHFIADDFNIIIGSALAKKNKIVSPKTTSSQLWLLDYRLNPLDKRINTSRGYNSNSTVTITALANGLVRRVNLPTITTTSEVKSWAIVDSETHEIYVGENLTTSLASGASFTPQPLYFNFVDNAVLKTLSMVN